MNVASSLLHPDACRHQAMSQTKRGYCSYVFATFDMFQDHVSFGERGLNVQTQEGIF